MGKEARVGLLLGASACLLAVLVDWAVAELRQCGPAPQQDTAPQQNAAPQEDPVPQQE